ncbi:MAG: hypothetical protein ACREX4_07320 [Gammaproteobacteria bacterium]
MKLLPREQELYVFAESRDRIHKERAMRRRQLKGLVKRLKQLQQMKLNDTRQLLLKLGEAKGRYRAGWRLLDLVLPQASGALPEPAAPDIQPQLETSGATDELRKAQPNFSFRLNRQKLRHVRRREGRYLLRTNLCGHNELWQLYIQLTEVEAAFKNLKDDLQLRPIYHQLEHHIEAHRLHGLLPAHELKSATEAIGARSYLTCRARQVRRYPDGRCALPHHRWPHLDLEPLHRAQPRPATSSGTTQPHSPAPTTPANNRRRTTRALKQSSHL